MEAQVLFLLKILVSVYPIQLLHLDLAQEQQLMQLPCQVGVLVMQLVQVLVLLCQVGVSLVLLVLLVDKEKEEILQMPSLLKVMILQSKMEMEMEMEMETEMNEVERDRRGARLVCGSTTPRRSWSLRITGRHVFRGGLTVNSQNANSEVDVRAIMEQQGSALHQALICLKDWTAAQRRG